MKIALIDNGSLEPAAHAALRASAAALAERADIPVEAVSWKHSDRIAPEALGGQPAWTLAAWIRAQVGAGGREFVFIPFFISPQGAIGSFLRRDLESLQAATGGFEFSFTEGLAPGPALAAIVASRVRAAVADQALVRPALVIVDHGGPSRLSAEVRDRVAGDVGRELGPLVRSVVAASMETPDGPDFAFNRPLLSEALGGSGDVVIAPLFLSPGRHAGPGGVLDRIARAAEARSPGLRCHFAALVGSHPIATEFLAGALLRALPAPIHP
jgi:sirohydrochlorin ferrochelatase